MSKLSGKVAVVTGASQGIGAGIAKSLAAESASVVVNYLKNKDSADSVVESIVASGGKAIAFGADVSDPEGAEGLIDAAIKSFGRLDILVNNSGVYEFAPLEAITLQSYDRVFKTNVLGVVLTTQAGAKHMTAGGSIINVGSNITSMLMPTSAIYAGSKAAVNAITRVLSKELGPKKIRVNCVMPGPVDTETSRAMGGGNSEQVKMIIGMTPLGRIGQPEDIASVVTFLASEDAVWVTGALLLNSGGL
jgi:3-oxoacyl-[acyl-carrier protein] reductase